MARRRNRADILAEIEDLKKQLAESEEREERRIGKIANKAGLLDLEISDEDLTKALTELAARFRKGRHKAPAVVDPPAAASEAGAGSKGSQLDDGARA
ncbi:MAG: TraC family protein [Methylobacterium sp.]|uniref:TraC family protein n=1 Tax=Methylobacterium sp. TaxID=409 RepID=UPI0025D5FE65|nr:TraC family protein [Methylobacterium sp.]MBX9933525.1 TraC family protein [Methylobacterium sp.]